MAAWLKETLREIIYLDQVTSNDLQLFLVLMIVHIVSINDNLTKIHKVFLFKKKLNAVG
jgi:hypothetical protein